MHNSSTQSMSLITKKEAATRLCTTRSFIDQLLAKKLLPRVRLSYKVIRIPSEALEAFIASRTEVAK